MRWLIGALASVSGRTGQGLLVVGGRGGRGAVSIGGLLSPAAAASSCLPIRLFSGTPPAFRKLKRRELKRRKAEAKAQQEEAQKAAETKVDYLKGRKVEIEAENAVHESDLPEGVKMEFYVEHRALHAALTREWAKKDALRHLCSLVQTPQEAALFEEVARRWLVQRMPRPSAEHSDFFFGALLASGGYDNILNIWCDRPRFRVIPADKHVLRLMATFRKLGTEAAKSGDESAFVENLDNVYKCFAVALYHDIPPSPALY
ncbi:hypothetical protein HK104_010240, partial [Borealophlyctis nickersoniae]